jgi:acetyl-CoA/propionyl-CoA carboxylase biotin carboxyl carrier protein
MHLRRLLVANRGEVALRVIRAAKKLGLRTVAVYSDADRRAPHVAEADLAVWVGPSPATESYLSIDALLSAAKQAGADAVHPGYGFLSENAEFAAACESAGLVFVGPQPAVIELMSKKDRARRVAAEAGARVLPAVVGSDPAELARRAPSEIGFPALVKAVAGGGGKGMRVVHAAGDLEEAVALAASEAQASFGDGSLFVERYLPGARHLEVQVVGDGAGGVLHLFDRDCSVQRRYQKVVEEAPAVAVAEKARAQAIKTAVRLAEKVSYRSLGTVEFLAAGEEVFFLEMNTRLQVEHGVTEEVTGLDLVELQLRLAAGEGFPLTQPEIATRGHAIEARVYAEDAEHGFAPQAGTVTHVLWPSSLRVETSLTEGQEVGSFYDPMLAKLVAHAETREAARQKLVDAVDNSAIFGVTTNLGFVRRLLASEEFARAEITTSWLDEHTAELGAADWRAPLAAGALYLASQARSRSSRDPFGTDGWRAGAPPAPARIRLFVNGQPEEVLVHWEDGKGCACCGSVKARTVRLEGNSLIADVHGDIERFWVKQDSGALDVAHRGAAHHFALEASSRRPDARADGSLAAPLPGTLVSVHVSAGDPVREGDLLGVLESMKMQYPLRAPLAGKVEKIPFEPGSHVGKGDLLFQLSQPEGV